MKVLRFDAPLGLGLRPPKKMRGGALRLDGHFTKPGVFPYQDQTGRTVMEYRPSSEVFAPASIESWKGVPVTDGHPSDLVTSDTWREHAIGHMGDDVRVDGDKLAASLVLQRKDAVDRASTRQMRGLSGGYWCELDSTPGVTAGDPNVPDGIRYDGVQRAIEGNHCAGLHSEHDARLGTDMTMRLDSKGNQRVRHFRTDDKGHAMKTTFLGKSYDLDDAGDCARLDAAIESDAADRKVRTDAADSLTKERDELKGRLDAAEAEVAKLPERVAQGVASRVALELRGRAVLGEKFDAKLDDKAMASAIRAGMEAAIKADDAAATLEGESDDYVRGRFERLHVDAAKVDESHAAVRGAIRTAQSTVPVDVGALYRASVAADK